MPRADTFAANPHWLPPVPNASIDHVPGVKGWPMVGNMLEILRDPPGFLQRMHARFGPVHRHGWMGGRTVMLLGPEANELVLFDRDKVFSSEQGWGTTLNQLFPRGLMLMDFDKHRVHRRTLSVAFKPEPMRLYADVLNEGIAEGVRGWSGKTFPFYPAIKLLTLDLAAVAFLGTPVGAEAAAVNQAFVDMVQAAVAPIRMPIRGTAMGRGVAGRRFLIEYFGRKVPRRRAGTGDDMFSQICRAEHEDGSRLSDAEIVDHMNFMMMAAHDTITSSATSMVMQLGRHPEWQDALRAEMASLNVDGDALPYDRLGELVLTDQVFKESLRLMPPVPSIPRRAVKPFSFGGYDLPAGTFLGVNTAFVHRMAEHWPDPDRFDPTRFTPEASRGRHKYAFVPFGGGAHMCLGLHFATMQIKLLMWHLLRRHRIELAPGAGATWQAWPIPRPRDGLPLSVVEV